MTMSEEAKGVGELYKMKKEDLSSDINAFFGVEVDWTKLSKDDLVSVYLLFTDANKVMAAYPDQAPVDARMAQGTAQGGGGLAGELLGGIGGGQLLDGLGDHLLKSGSEYMVENRPLRNMIKNRLGGLGGGG
jgi:hypothetical protein